MKKFIAVVLTILLVSSTFIGVYSMTDTMIYTDPVKETYIGLPEAANLIDNLNFKDVAPDYWAKESIVRSGALNMIKGYEDVYNPNEIVSNQEALAFVLRVLGRENDAQNAAVAVQGQLPAGSPLRTLWSLGYLNVAMQTGLITRAQYNDALVPDQSTLSPAANFIRGNPAAREQVADWLVRGLQSVNPTVFDSAATEQSIYTFSDWENISPNFVSAMENVLRTGIMSGSGGRLNPKGSLSRAEMAQVLRNMDSIYYGLQGITKKTGTVAGIKDDQTTTTGTGVLNRDIYIRTADGTVDIIRRQMDRNSSPQSGTKDAVVFKGGSVSGLYALTEGDEIEYLVRPGDKTVLYVQAVATPMEVKTLKLKLVEVNYTKATITVTDSSGKNFTYPLAAGVLGVDYPAGKEPKTKTTTTTTTTAAPTATAAASPTPAPDPEGTVRYIYVGEVKRDVKKLPVGSVLELTLNNNVVTKLNYLGEPSVITETRGIVVENNTAMGYLTIIDNNGNEVTKYYFEDDITVEKQQYYDIDDEIGNIDEMFPHFEYDPRDTVISDIEPGDIVFIRPDPSSPENILSISASTSYLYQYGKIKEFTVGSEISTMLVEYENKQTAWFDIANEIFVSKEGVPIDFSDIHVGDWAKILVNQAVLAPGNIMESVKELVIEGDGHFVADIVKGQLAGLNAVQNQLLVQNPQILTETGWSNYQNMNQFSIAGRDIEYYYAGKRISLDYASQYLKRSNGEVYIALENNFTGAKVKKVTFRTGADQWLPADTVINADGNGGYSIVSNNGTISTDAGTIVRRNGRLVDGKDIKISDYAVTSLNGGNTAAVVDISQTPGVTGIMIARGRILSVNDGTSFKVQSMSTLSGNEWFYTPVQREFAIDYNTLFLNSGGYVDDSTFVGYTDASVRDRVYNIVIDGSRAARVIDSSYAQKSVRGTIYEATPTSLSIKDVTYYDDSTGRWLTVSDRNNTAVVTVPAHAIIVKNNGLVTADDLKVGNQIKVMTDELPDRITSGFSSEGYIIQVEK